MVLKIKKLRQIELERLIVFEVLEEFLAAFSYNIYI
jgi:hypothetical protein